MVVFKGKETNYRSTEIVNRMVSPSSTVSSPSAHTSLSMKTSFSAYEDPVGIIDWDTCLKDSYPLLKRVGLREPPRPSSAR